MTDGRYRRPEIELKVVTGLDKGMTVSTIDASGVGSIEFNDCNKFIFEEPTRKLIKYSTEEIDKIIELLKGLHKRNKLEFFGKFKRKWLNGTIIDLDKAIFVEVMSS